MHTVNPYVQSLDEEILSASPCRLVLLLLRGARQSAMQARQALRDGQVRERSLAISRAIERLGELCRDLDHERGGEISTRLAALYDYMIERLNEANMRQSEAPLAEVSELLVPLIEAWSELDSDVAPGGASADPGAARALDLCA